MKINTSKESESAFERPKIPEGLYDATLKEVKEIGDGQYGKRVVFIYLVSDNKVEIGHICYVPEIATPENKMGRVLLAHKVELGKEVDTTALIGSSVKVMVEDYEYEDEGVKKKASSITKVKPLVDTQSI